jgi:hypothetical protein
MDPDLYYGIVRTLSSGKVPDTINKETQRLVEKVTDHYTLHKTILYKKDESRHGTLEDSSRGRQQRNRQVIPRTKLTETLKQLHDAPLAGHLGQDNTYQQISQHYYWPGMKKDVIRYVQTCKICQKRQRRRGEAPLEPIQKYPEPFYQIGVDVMGPMPRTPTGKRYIVVAVDHFTKWVEARALEEADAQSIVQFLYEDIICRHGVPTLMTTDRGTEFINELVTTLANIYKIRHIRTTAYHPQGNGQVERTNRIIKDILAKITPSKPGDWSIYLPSALSVIRNTRQQSTKFTPSELLHGYQLRQPFESSDHSQELHDPIEYAQEEFGRIQDFRTQAHGFIRKAQDRQRSSHDNQVQILPPLKIGDLVLVWRDLVEVNLSAKLERKWEGPYLVRDIKATTHWLKNRHSGSPLPKPYHRNRLKLYHDRQPLKKRPIVEIEPRTSSSPVQARSTPFAPKPLRSRRLSRSP